MGPYEKLRSYTCPWPWSAWCVPTTTMSFRGEAQSRRKIPWPPWRWELSGCFTCCEETTKKTYNILYYIYVHVYIYVRIYIYIHIHNIYTYSGSSPCFITIPLSWLIFVATKASIVDASAKAIERASTNLPVSGYQYIAGWFIISG